ncbi:50S ribosomal protein L3 [Bradymonas sediminis]|uniref:Large ribosomal subunit protein uL3 n=1 Tax=Bradymonas sediminis TaxID=1548548 RepID=A0A2Z4FJP2_9DELT|nr:50S ribosomal protein L3 [Bradymonas sediminis]AWV89163.1 50S ribosomal protein L3 [Bradymonas sediminis]TDP64370.1 LSU ribosomal protein L3P [Bradymonas sediminis]
MRKGMLGEKIGMTQLFGPTGVRIPVTVIKVAGNVVIQKKSVEGKDGYSAVKIGFGDVKKLEKEGTESKYRLSRPEVGVFTAAGIDAPRKHVREFRVSEADLDAYTVGEEIPTDFFEAGEYIDATATSKGRGFAGVMVRHNFGGGKATHGVHEAYRHGGSIGMSADPARVLAGTKMAGQSGNATVTIQNLQVVQVLPEEKAILVKGSVPGAKGSLVMLRTATKKYQG